MADILDTLNVENTNNSIDNTSGETPVVEGQAPMTFTNEYNANNLKDQSKISNEQEVQGPTADEVIYNDNVKKQVTEDNKYDLVNSTGSIERLRPDLATTSKSLEVSDGSVDIYVDPILEELYNKADSQTKEAMLDSWGNENAIKTYHKRMLYNEATKQIEKDGTLSMVGNTLLSSLLSPDIIFGGAIFKGANLGFKGLKVASRFRPVLAGATTALTEAELHEGLQDLGGLDAQYKEVILPSILLGGGLPFVFKSFSGAYKKDFEKFFSPKAPNAEVTQTKYSTADFEAGKANISDEDFIQKTIKKEDGTEEIVTVKAGEVNNIKQKYGEDSQEYRDYKATAEYNLETKLKKQGLLNKEDLKNYQFEGKLKRTVDLIDSKPKFWKKGITFGDDLTKLIYLSSSKSQTFNKIGVKKSDKFKQELNKILDLPDNVREEIYTILKQQASKGEVVNVHNLKGIDLSEYSIKQQGYYKKIKDEFNNTFDENAPTFDTVKTNKELFNPETDIHLQVTQKEKKNILDKIPLINKLRSDVEIAGKSDSDIIRAYTNLISTSAISQKTLDGKLTSINKTAFEVKNEVEGIFGDMVDGVQNDYKVARAQKNGYKGSLEDYKDDIVKEHAEAVNKQDLDASEYANDLFDETAAPIKKQYAEIQKNIDKINNQTGRDKLEVMNEIEELEKLKLEFEYMLKNDTDLDSLLNEINEEILTWKKLNNEIDNEKALFDLKERRSNLISVTQKNVRKRLKDEYYSKNSLEYSNDLLTPGAKRINEYYHKVAKQGKQKGLTGLENYNLKKGYSPRNWNFDDYAKIDRETRVNRIEQALLSHPDNRTYRTIKDKKTGLEVRKYDLTLEEIKIMAEELDANLHAKAVNTNNNVYALLSNKTLPFGTHLETKSMSLNEDFLGDLIVRDFEVSTGLYNYQMSGRIAMQHAFKTDDIDLIDKNLETMNRNAPEGQKYTIEEKAAFNALVEDIIGTLRINKNKDGLGMSLTRTITAYNISRMGGGFGLNQVIELTGVVMANGLNPYLYKGSGRALKNAWKGLVYGISDEADEFAHVMKGEGLMSSLRKNSTKNKMTDDSGEYRNMGFVEEKLSKINNALMNVNGLRMMVDFTENIIGNSLIKRIGGGLLSDKEAARWGLLNSDIKKIQKLINQHVDFDNNKFNFDKWDEESIATLKLAIGRGVKEMVVQSDSIHLPRWMKIPNAANMLITQFLRFPLIAHTTLLRRGYTEEQAKLAANLFGTTLAYSSINYVREQAAIKSGFINELDAKYDIFNDPEAILTLSAKSINYAGSLGFLSSLYNYSMIITGNTEIGSKYNANSGLEDVAGPSAGILGDMQKMVQKLQSGERLSSRDLKMMKRYFPFMNLPWLDEALKDLANDMGQ